MRRPDALPTSCFRAYMQNAYSVFAEWVIRLCASLRVAEAPSVQNRVAHPMLFLASLYGFFSPSAGTISQRTMGIRRRHPDGQGHIAARLRFVCLQEMQGVFGEKLAGGALFTGIKPMILVAAASKAVRCKQLAVETVFFPRLVHEALVIVQPHDATALRNRPELVVG